MTDGIHIPREVADSERVPEDLDANVVGPYRFPDPRRRRIAGWLYLATAAVMAVFAVGQPGFVAGVVLLAGLGVWHVAASWPLGIEQEDALARAAVLVPFAVGHASAAVTFRGWRSRPHWHVVLYSADDPPSRRALVRLDAVTGERVDEVYTEAVPNPGAATGDAPGSG